MTTALLGTAVLLWQLATGPVSSTGAPRGEEDSSATGSALAPRSETRFEPVSGAPSGGISTTGIIERLPDTATSVTGTASWYCGGGSRCTRGYPGGLYAAAGPALRTGDWRGRRVTVCSSGRCVNVKLIDTCACGGGRVIDLYRQAFSRLADPSRGIIRVSVTWGGGAPATLPPTDSD